MGFSLKKFFPFAGKVLGGFVGSQFGMPQLGAAVGGKLGGAAAGNKPNESGSGSGTDHRFGLSANFGSNSSNRSETMNRSTTPILSQEWRNAFDAGRNNLNAGGFTAPQQQSVDFFSRRMNGNNPLTGAVNTANAGYDASLKSYSDLIAGQNWMAGRPAYQLRAAPTSEYAGDVTARTGASFTDAYRNPYENDVVAATSRDAWKNADRSANAFRQAADASGAFGDRFALAQAQLAADQTADITGQLSNLRYQGFNTAAGFGQQDAGRFLTADMGNQSTRQQNNQYNSGLLDSRERANIGYKQDQHANIFKAADNIRTLEGDKSDLQQRKLDNIAAVDAIDVATAEKLFDLGKISQAQLMEFLEATRHANGETSNQNSSSREASREFGLPASANRTF